MSSDDRQQPAALNMPQQAVSNYLSALLSEAETEPVKPPACKSTGTIRTVPGPSHAVGRQSSQTDTSSPRKQQGTPLTAPGWSKEPFQTLFCKVEGVTLAVPLCGLHSIVHWHGDANSLPGQPDWQIGVIRHRGRFVGLVDSLRLIMPERQHAAPVSGRREGHILIIGDGRWGLYCDSLQRPQTLDKEDVRWRMANKGRPWIAGMLVERLCVLLDTEALLDYLWHK